MKKVLFLAVSLLVLSNCKSKENKNEPTIDEDIEVVDETSTNDEPTKDPKADQDLLDPKQGVIVVFKSDITETENLINEKGLKIDKVLFDESSLKVGLIKVPADKKDYWLTQLIESGNFKDVKLYSEKNLEELIKNQGNKK